MLVTLSRAGRDQAGQESIRGYGSLGPSGPELHSFKCRLDRQTGEGQPDRCTFHASMVQKPKSTQRIGKRSRQ